MKLTPENVQSLIDFFNRFDAYHNYDDDTVQSALKELKELLEKGNPDVEIGIRIGVKRMALLATDHRHRVQVKYDQHGQWCPCSYEELMEDYKYLYEEEE